MHLSRSNGAVQDLEAAPAMPPATRCCHQKLTHSVRHLLQLSVLRCDDAKCSAIICKHRHVSHHVTVHSCTLQ